MIVPDVNVLVYAHRPESPDHAAWVDWLRRLANGPAAFGCSELALSAFVRIATNPRVFIDPTPPDVALAFCRLLLDRPNCVPLRGGPRRWSIFAELVAKTDARGKLVADAWHAALVIEHGGDLATADSDFGRFEGLRWHHPLGR